MPTLTQLLWERWGTAEHPAEWDGREGGGRGSQRFWEYLWTLNQINPPDVRVLDVGGGETLFFFNLLSGGIHIVEIVDPLVEPGDFRAKMDLVTYVAARPPSHNYDIVTCVSVLEHVERKEEFCAALDTFRCRIVMTFELGPGCIEMSEMYRLLLQFKRHHITKMESCPVLADNSKVDLWRPIGIVLEPNQ